MCRGLTPPPQIQASSSEHTRVSLLALVFDLDVRVRVQLPILHGLRRCATARLHMAPQWSRLSPRSSFFPPQAVVAARAKDLAAAEARARAAREDMTRAPQRASWRSAHLCILARAKWSSSPPTKRWPHPAALQHLKRSASCFSVPSRHSSLSRRPQAPPCPSLTPSNPCTDSILQRPNLPREQERRR